MEADHFGEVEAEAETEANYSVTEALFTGVPTHNTVPDCPF